MLTVLVYSEIFIYLFCISALVQVPTPASNSLKLFVEYQTNPVLSTVTQTHEICCFGNELNLV